MRGFFKIKGELCCKACGGTAIEIGISNACARCCTVGCPNDMTAETQSLVDDAKEELARRARILAEECNKLCDGLESFASWEPSGDSVTQGKMAGASLRRVAKLIEDEAKQKMHTAMWTPEALVELASKKEKS